MMLPTFAQQTVTLLRAETITDGHGNEVRDWANPTETVVNNCAVQPLTSDEVITGRDAEMGSHRLHLPAGTDVVGSDRVRLGDGGRDFEVIGEPLPWTSPTGRLDHTEIVIRRWEG